METAMASETTETEEQANARVQAHLMALCEAAAKALTNQGGGDWIAKPKSLAEHRYETQVVHAESGDYLTPVGAVDRWSRKTMHPTAWAFHPNGRSAGEKREIRYPVNEAGDPNFAKIAKRVEERLESAKRSAEWRAAQAQAATLVADKVGANAATARLALRLMQADSDIAVTESTGVFAVVLPGAAAARSIRVTPTEAGIHMILNIPADRLAAVLLAIKAAI